MLTPDTLLQNRYLVQKQIGKGGMGVVYLATDQRFGSTVAIKETLIDKPQFLKAFEREARLLNHLKHPALPRVSDHFTEGDGQFLVMEYVPGPDLGETLKARGIPFTRASVLEWADQLLDTLDYLHTQKPPVVHRDIKPQNLKLNPRGDVMLLDFGLAKGTPLHSSDASMTASLFGYSFHYAPLEQMQGTGTDPRSDLYSLAATLYHLLTGVTPPDALTRATAVLNGEPDPLKPAHKIQAQVTAPVAAVLAKAMALRPAERPQTAAQMRAALREGGQRVAAVSIPVIASQLPEAQPFKQVKLVDTGSAAPSVAASDAGQRSRTSDSYNARTVVSPDEASSDRSSVNPQSRNDSFTTRVRVYQSPEQPQGSNRAGAILIGVLLLAALAATVVYALTRSSATQPATVQTVQAPTETAEPLPSTFNDSQSRPAASQSLNEPAVPASQSGQRAGASSQSQPVEVGSNPQQPATADNSRAQLKPQDNSASPASSSALTREEERAREAEEARQRIRDRDEEERRRREADDRDRERARMEMERQREMQRREPPPPPGMGPPAPRRGGPPPF